MYGADKAKTNFPISEYLPAASVAAAPAAAGGEADAPASQPLPQLLPLHAAGGIMLQQAQQQQQQQQFMAELQHAVRVYRPPCHATCIMSLASPGTCPSLHSPISLLGEAMHR